MGTENERLHFINRIFVQLVLFALALGTIGLILFGVAWAITQL